MVDLPKGHPRVEVRGMCVSSCHTVEQLDLRMTYFLLGAWVYVRDSKAPLPIVAESKRYARVHGGIVNHDFSDNWTRFKRKRRCKFEYYAGDSRIWRSVIYYFAGESG